MEQIEGISMDKKIKLLVITSLVAVMATGCSRFNRSNYGGVSADGGYADVSGEGSSSQRVGGSQVRNDGSRRGLFSQQRSSTCSPCAANNTQTTARVYKPAAPKPYRRAPAAAPYRPAGQHSQQWYVDRWKRQQQQGQSKARTHQQNTNSNYTNYDSGSNATYYDYSSAGKTKTYNAPSTNTNVSASNKSIYTGSYQKKTYKPYNPTTYSGGSSASTNTNTTYVSNSGAKGGGSTYIVKKGDTVFEIMRQTGVYWKDIIKLNNLQAPAYNINPGQAIRLK